MEIEKAGEGWKINVDIQAIVRKDTKKDGTPYIDKNKKPFSVVSINVGENLINDKDWNGWCSVMDYGNDFMMESGERLTGMISKREVDDKVFWNFRKFSRVDLLEDRILALEDHVFGNKMVEEVEEKVEEDDDEDLDLPF